MKLEFALAAGLACAAAPALAQSATQPNVPARYSFNRVDDGFLRLDNSSGQLSFCSPHSVGWACQAVPEDRAALEKEIARLQDEVAGLKKEVAALRRRRRRWPRTTTPKSNCRPARTSSAPAPPSKMPGTGWST